MKKTIALLPVDARPVTYDLPKDLAKIANWNLLIPEKRDLGFMKSRANIDKVFSWLEQVMPKVDGIIVSVDMLLYGGLVPSRINDEAPEVIEGRQIGRASCRERVEMSVGAGAVEREEGGKGEETWVSSVRAGG